MQTTITCMKVEWAFITKHYRALFDALVSLCLTLHLNLLHHASLFQYYKMAEENIQYVIRFFLHYVPYVKPRIYILYIM